MKQKIQSYWKDLSKRRIVIAVASLVCLFLGSLNFLNGYFYFFWLAFALMLFGKEIVLPRPIVLITMLISAFAWIFFSTQTFDSITIIIKPFAFVIAFIFGYNFFLLLSNGTKSYEKTFYIVLGIFALGAILHVALNYFSMEEGAVRWKLVDFWTKENISATIMAAICAFPISVASALLFTKNNIWLKIAAVLTLALVVVYNLLLAGRTLFVLAVLMLGFAFCFYMIHKKKIKLLLLLGSIGVAVCAVGLYLLVNDLLPLPESIKQSNFYLRFFTYDNAISLTKDSRLSLKWSYLKSMYKYLFGGGLLYKEVDGFAHDLIMDCYSMSGIFGIVGWVVILAYNLYYLFKIIPNKNIPFNIRQLLACFFISCYIFFNMEPVLIGIPWLAIDFCLCTGMVIAYADCLTVKKGKPSKIRKIY